MVHLAETFPSWWWREGEELHDSPLSTVLAPTLARNEVTLLLYHTVDRVQNNLPVLRSPQGSVYAFNPFVDTRSENGRTHSIVIGKTMYRSSVQHRRYTLCSVYYYHSHVHKQAWRTAVRKHLVGPKDLVEEQ